MGLAGFLLPSLLRIEAAPVGPADETALAAETDPSPSSR
jgi:hypothetical protein